MYLYIYIYACKYTTYSQRTVPACCLLRTSTHMHNAGVWQFARFIRIINCNGCGNRWFPSYVHVVRNVLCQRRRHIYLAHSQAAGSIGNLHDCWQNRRSMRMHKLVICAIFVAFHILWGLQFCRYHNGYRLSTLSELSYVWVFQMCMILRQAQW